MRDLPRRGALAALAIAVVGQVSVVTLESCQGSAGETGGSGAAGGTAGSSGVGLFTDAAIIQPDACGGPSASDAGPGALTGCEGVEGGVSAAAAFAILNGCTGETCHVQPTRDTSVDVPASECCDGRPLIMPGNAAQSYLMDKIEGQNLCLGERMPLGLPPLADSDIATIRSWICEGAPAN